MLVKNWADEIYQKMKFSAKTIKIYIRVHYKEYVVRFYMNGEIKRVLKICIYEIFI